MLVGGLVLFYPVFILALLSVALLYEEELVTVAVTVRKLSSFAVYR